MAASENWYKLRNEIFQRNYDEANKLLKDNPKLISERNGIGETVLHYLSVENEVDGVAWIHTKGANLNTQNDFGAPPLFEISQLGYRKLVLWFLENGADLTLKNNEGLDIWGYLEDYDCDAEIQYLRSIT